MHITEILRRAVYFLRRDRLSAELREEMQLHVELRARQERQSGAGELESMQRARRRFGNRDELAAESRDQWGLRWLDELLLDLRYGVRALRRAPLPSAIIIAMLGVGIGATLAMFTVMDAALFRPLPVRAPEELVVMRGGDLPIAGSRYRPSALDLASLRKDHAYLADVGAYAAGGLNFTGGTHASRVQAGLISPSALRLLGVRPLLGRLFTEEEELPTAPDVVVLSYRTWKSQFGGDHNIIGRRVSLNDRAYEVVGVMPPRFAFPEGSELWIPLPLPLTQERMQVFRFIISATFIARLAPGVSYEKANAHALALLESTGWKRDASEPPPVVFQPLRDVLVGKTYLRLYMVMGLAALLLLASCANISGLLLARWSSRRREIAVRAAIGASRRRLLRQLTTESLVLAFAGTMVGVFVAFTAVELFNALMPIELAALAAPVVDSRSLAALGLIALAVGIAIGTLPALAASRGDLTPSLRAAASQALCRPNGWRLGSILVIVETSFAVVLLVASGLLVKSLAEMHRIDTGLHPEHVVTARVALSNTKYKEAADRVRFFARLQGELQQDARLEVPAIVSTLPLRGEWHPPVAFDLLDRPTLKRSPFAELVYASPRYFEALGIGLVAGRTFVAADTFPEGGAIISESLAREWWPGTSPLGARVSVGRESHVIVGVVKDVRGTSLNGEQNPQVYTPFRSSFYDATIVARSSRPDAVALASIRAAVARVDTAQVVFDMKTMAQVADDALLEERTTSTLASTFGMITLILAALGLYGMLAYSIVQRLPELGIRFALGARPAQILRGIIAEGLLLTLAGCVIGIAIASAATRVIASQLFQVKPLDSSVFAIVSAMLLVTSLLATLVPAWKASRADPMQVLRAG